MSALSDQAQALAAAGIAVFPCQENGKMPVTERGFYEATTDAVQIAKWWSTNPHYNIGVCPEDAGWCVIDIDPGGDTAWIALLAEHGEHEPTYTVQTPRGGLHLYFTGSLPPSASKLAEHVDTRGRTSYVLVPPSIVNGKPYRVLHDRDIAAVPTWIATSLAALDQRVRASFTDLDTPTSISRARAKLADKCRRGDVAISGCGGNDRTYQTFAELLNLGVSDETALRLVLEDWNPHCQPPWDEDDLRTILEHAGRYAQNEAGAWAVNDPTAAFGQTAAFREAMAAQQPKRSRYAVRTEADMDNRLEPAWIIPNLIPEDACVLWIGRSQSFKSFLLLSIFLAVASEHETFGCTPKSGICIYGALEGLPNIETARRRAWRSAHQIEGPLDNFRTCMVPYLGMPGDYEEWKAELAKSLGDKKMRLLAIDTAGKVLGGLNENASENVRSFWKMCDDLRETFGCTVVAIHHSGKDADRGPRGSGAWTADFDTIIETVRPNASELAVEVRVLKHKDAADGQRWAFKGREFLGSLVFFPASAEELTAAKEDANEFSPSKIGRLLAKRQAHDMEHALSTPELAVAMFPGELGNEKLVRRLEKLGRTALKAYCQDHDGVLWWYYEKLEGSA